MGQYLTVGVATKIFIEKGGEEKENLRDEFNKNFNLKLYDIYEEENYFILTLKKEMLEKNISKLIGEMKQKARQTGEEDYNNIERELNKKKYDEILEIAKEKKLYRFQFFEGSKFTNDVGYILKESRIAFCDIIGIEMDGKVFFECYYDIFYFLRNSIIESLKNELKDAIVVTLIG